MDAPSLPAEYQSMTSGSTSFRSARRYALNVKHQSMCSFSPLGMKLADHLVVFAEMGLRAEAEQSGSEDDGDDDSAYGSTYSKEVRVQEWRSRVCRKREELNVCLRDEARHYNLVVELRQMLRDHYVVNYLGQPAADLESFYAGMGVDYTSHVAFGYWEELLGRMERESRRRAEWQKKRESRDTENPSDQPLSPEPPKLTAETTARRVAAMCSENGADGEWEVLLDIIRENAGKLPHERDNGGGVYRAMIKAREWDKLARRLRNDEAQLMSRFSRRGEGRLRDLIEEKVKERNENVFLDNQPVDWFVSAGGKMGGAIPTDEALDWASRLEAGEEVR